MRWHKRHRPNNAAFHLSMSLCSFFVCRRNVAWNENLNFKQKKIERNETKSKHSTDGPFPLLKIWLHRSKYSKFVRKFYPKLSTKFFDWFYLLSSVRYRFLIQIFEWLYMLYKLSRIHLNRSTETFHSFSVAVYLSRIIFNFY